MLILSSDTLGFIALITIGFTLMFISKESILLLIKSCSSPYCFLLVKFILLLFFIILIYINYKFKLYQYTPFYYLYSKFSTLFINDENKNADKDFKPIEPVVIITIFLILLLIIFYITLSLGFFQK